MHCEVLSYRIHLGSRHWSLHWPSSSKRRFRRISLLRWLENKMLPASRNSCTLSIWRMELCVLFWNCISIIVSFHIDHNWKRNRDDCHSHGQWIVHWWKVLKWNQIQMRSVIGTCVSWKEETERNQQVLQYLMVIWRWKSYFPWRIHHSCTGIRPVVLHRQERANLIIMEGVQANSRKWYDEHCKMRHYIWSTVALVNLLIVHHDRFDLAWVALSIRTRS